MKIPPFFIGATVLFWGYEKNQLLISIIVFILIEGARFTKKRWKFGLEDFIKISDLTSIILISVIVLILMNYESRYFLKITTQWLPLILLPLILTQTYSVGNTIIIGTRIGSKKVKNTPKKHHIHRPMDFRFFYFAITLLGAATANSRHDAFFPLLCLLTVWLLYCNRGQAFSNLSFCLVIILVLLLSFSGIQAMDRTHANFNKMMVELWQQYIQNRGADPFKTRTAFGDVGRLKLSGKIIMRLRTEDDDSPPALLKEAGYNVFSTASWFNRDRNFTTIPYNEKIGWQIADTIRSDAKKLHVEKYFTKSRGLIPYPNGIEQINGLSITDLSINIEGLLRIKGGETLQKYDLSFDERNVQTAPPGQYNLLIPEREKVAIKTITDQLAIEALSDTEKIKRIQRFFHNNFAYTLTTQGKGQMETPLANFLLKRRAGHCELFATATALLLRDVGIPSRYITGYAVAEKSLLEQKYIIRSRHGHAWTEAYVDGHWLTIDTTPSRWLDEDERSASIFEPVRDFFSFVKHQFNLFKMQENEGGNTILSIVAFLLTSFLVIRIYRRLEKSKSGKKQQELTRFAPQESPFFLIEDAINKNGPGRMENEPFHLWMQRVEAKEEIDTASLYPLYHLHQRLRFDPENMPESERRKLEEGVREWLDRGLAKR